MGSGPNLNQAAGFRPKLKPRKTGARRNQAAGSGPKFKPREFPVER
jgi:hypothetical protein